MKVQTGSREARVQILGYEEVENETHRTRVQVQIDSQRDRIAKKNGCLESTQ